MKLKDIKEFHLKDNERNTVIVFGFIALIIYMFLIKFFVGIITYFLSFVIIDNLQRYYIKNNKEYEITYKKGLFIVCFLYFIEQYILLKYGFVTYGILCLIIGIFFGIYCVIFYFKFDSKNRVIWIGVFWIIFSIFSILYFNVLNPSIISVWINYIVAILSILIIMYCDSIFIAYNKLFLKILVPILCLKSIYSYLEKKLYFEKIWNYKTTENSMELYRYALIIVMFLMVFSLKKMYNNLKKMRFTTLKEKSINIFILIVFIYWTIKAIIVIVTNYSVKIWNIW